jgi:hypothetical protein
MAEIIPLELEPARFFAKEGPAEGEAAALPLPLASRMRYATCVLQNFPLHVVVQLLSFMAKM